MVAGTMDKVDIARVEPISDPEDGSLNSCKARETGRLCNFGKSGRPQGAARPKTRPCISRPNDVKCQKGGLSHV